MKLGLTGGIASGKTTAARMLQSWGASLVDSDELAHQAVAPGQPAYDQIVKHFGRGILRKDGTIDRSRLGEIVFRDAQERERLNQIVHPSVRQQWHKRLREFEAERGGSNRFQAVIAMIPLLYETKAEAEFDAVIVVGCRPETQLARLKGRGLTDHQCQARLDAQMPIHEKMQRADFVIWNEYSLAILEQQTRMIWSSLSKRNQS